MFRTTPPRARLRLRTRLSRNTTLARSMPASRSRARRRRRPRPKLRSAILRLPRAPPLRLLATLRFAIRMAQTLARRAPRRPIRSEASFLSRPRRNRRDSECRQRRVRSRRPPRRRFLPPSRRRREPIRTSLIRGPRALSCRPRPRRPWAAASRETQSKAPGPRRRRLAPKYSCFRRPNLRFLPRRTRAQRASSSKKRGRRRFAVLPQMGGAGRPRSSRPPRR